MGKFYFVIIGIIFSLNAGAQTLVIPDAAFKNVLVTQLCASLDNNWTYETDVDTNNDNEIQLSEALAVQRLNVAGKSLISIDGVQLFTNLISLDFANNQISAVNLAGLNGLTQLTCRNNSLTNLDLSTIPNLSSIEGQNNLYTTLDFSPTKVIQAYVSGCPNLEYINLKNGYTNVTWGWSQTSGSIFSLSNLPLLQAICLDDSEIATLQGYYNQGADNYPHPALTTYCSFTPGGNFYVTNGNVRYDSGADGCAFSDIIYPNLKFNFSNGTTSGQYVANASGAYSVPFVAGTHTITPVLENPSYFTVSPSSTSVTFPAQTSPVTQDYCVTANGSHDDLAITIIPVTVARPGFDAEYKVVFRNKGTTTQSGSINVTFDNDIIDYVSATPTATQSTNVLNWNFTNLLPFEKREITFMLNVNSPMETPSVQDGDILAFEAQIEAATDETPDNNFATLAQIVVNSLDPNDMTCLEGDVIPVSSVGKFVHYLIRFENVGSASAVNVVVKDMIDTAKFDMASLVPIDGSHPFVSKITGNKVEFIFEGINLPSDDANNDGYVTFALKTLPSLTQGQTFSNLANIYFDYNFPIVTNTETTTIATLAKADIEFSNHFTLYPNPAQNVLNIKAHHDIEMKSINVFNMLGQLIMAVPNAKDLELIDTTNLTQGSYFVKINTDKGTAVSRFVKE